MTGKAKTTAVLRTLKVAGEHIRLARLRRGWSQSKLAAMAGASERTIRSLENGVCGVSIGTYANVLAVLGLVDRMTTVAMPEADKDGTLMDVHRLPRRGKKRSAQSK